MKKRKPSSHPEKPPDPARRRVLAGVAAGSTLLLPGYGGNPAVAQQIMSAGQQSDAKCSIEKGTINIVKAANCVIDNMSLQCISE
jgi:hypothetical protein